MNVRLSDADALDTSADLLVLGLAEGDDRALDALTTRLGADLDALFASEGFERKPGEAVLLPSLGKVAADRIALVGLGDGADKALAKAATKAGHLARKHKAATLALSFGPLGAEALQAVCEHLSYGNYAFDRFLPEDKRTPALGDVVVCGVTATDDTATALSTAAVRSKWQSFARDLVNLPAADLYPESLAEHAKTLSELDHVEVEVWDFETCRAKGLVGIEAVGRGSSKPGVLIHVRYRPPAHKDHIAFVGKGVTFDSGGLSLKPSPYMQTMRCDMGGSATVLGATGAIAELGVPVAVDCFIPAVENMCAADSYKLGDILTYNNGVSVEIHNTDAEGRLVIADALILACEVEGVSRVVDAATLTGSVIMAVGPDYTGLFTADDGLADEILGASEATSEAFWRLPLHKPYNRMLEGTWSQIKNVGGREAGSITAALFLDHFVTDDVRWAHLDIAGTAFHDKAIDATFPGATGQVVRTLTAWAAGLGDA